MLRKLPDVMDKSPCSGLLYCIMTNLLKALLGNSPVNTFQHAPHKNIVEVFLCVRAWTIATQCMRGDVTQQ
jgi:hypothetical protein